MELVQPGGGSGPDEYVSSINAVGDPALTGAVTLSAGTNVTLTQVGNDIEISATGGGGTWGSITGTLSDQTDLQTALDLKANTALNNLGTTAINASLLFDANATYDIADAINGVKDIFFGASGVINFNNNNVTLAHSTGYLTASKDFFVGSSTFVAPYSSYTFQTPRFIQIYRGTATNNSNSNFPDVNFVHNLTAVTGDKIAGSFKFLNESTGSATEKRLVQFFAWAEGAVNRGALSVGTHDGTAFAERWRITSGGKMGLGATVPLTNFEIKETNTDTTPAFYINQASTGDSAMQFSIVGDAYAIGIDNSDNDAFKISYASTAGSAVLGTNDRVIIDASGNVGLGTTSTISAKLHLLKTTEQLRVGYDVSNYFSTTVGSTGGVTFDSVGSGAGFTFSDAVTINGLLTLSARDIATDTTTGMKIGTATTQKIGFYNKTPVVQPTALTTQLTTITATAPGTPDYAIQDLTAGGFGFVTADEGQSVLKVILNLQTRVGELETKLKDLGLLA